MDLKRICMENLNLTYYLVDLKIKNKAPVEIYFMSRVFQEHSHCYDKRKNKKNEVRKMNLFLLPPLPSQEVFVVATSTLQLFSQQNFLNFFFSLIHGYLDRCWAN